MFYAKHVSFMDKVAPIVTIAMPVKNRGWCIEEVLKSVKNQEYPKNRLQLVFVDGFSSDGTYEKVLKWVDEHGSIYADVLVLRDEGNIPRARNICLKQFKGHYMLWWDSDVLVPSNGIVRLLEHFMHEKVGIAGLPYDVDKPHLFDRVYRAREPENAGPVEAVGMGFTIVKDSVVKAVGSFNEKLWGNEDTEYCLRARKFGYTVILDPTVRCRHLRPEAFLTTRSYSEKRGRFNFFGFLRYNFTKAPEYVLEFVGSGSKRHFAKIGYYLALPLLLIMGIALLVLTDSPWILLAALLYSGLSVGYHIRKTHGIFYGLVASAIFVPAGVALAYGALRMRLSKLIKSHAESDPYR